MTDINREIEKDLQDIGVESVFFYPEKFSDLPVVSFYTLTEKGHMSWDNAEAITYGAVQVDIWDTNPAETGRIADKIKTGLAAKGWAREYSGDVPPEDGIYHRTIRFSKIF